MQKPESKYNTLVTGLAMFSMFFGAGNVVFPLALGQYAQDKNIFAIIGLLISAVGVPFLGLIAMTLFNGNYKLFFERIGKIPGFLVSAAIMALIGPFGAIPRCITLSFATLKIYFSELDLLLFSIVSCLLILAFTIRKNNILDYLGYILTPILIGSLAIIILKGVFISPAAPVADHSQFTIFWRGLVEGYQTMDLLGAFFFSTIVLACLERAVDTKNPQNFKKVIWLALKASLVGAFLLSLAYVGFSFVSAFNSDALIGVPKDELAGQVANVVLGPYAGIIACTAVSLACLTTAIALAAVFAEFLQKDISHNKISYEISLTLTLIVTMFISTLNFNGIANFLAPILQVCYPALIVLSIVNIAYKVSHFKPVKIPVFIAFGLSLIGYLFL